MVHGFKLPIYKPHLSMFMWRSILLDICVLASLLLKQIFKHDVGYDGPTCLAL